LEIKQRAHGYDILHSDLYFCYGSQKNEFLSHSDLYFCYGSKKTEFLWPYIFVMAAKKLNFYGEKGLKFLSKIQNSDFCKKWTFFFQFFHRSSAKSRRTAKRLLF